MAIELRRYFLFHSEFSAQISAECKLSELYGVDAQCTILVAIDQIHFSNSIKFYNNRLINQTRDHKIIKFAFICIEMVAICH